MVTTYMERVTQTKAPLFMQPDLRRVREIAARTLLARRAALLLRRRPSRAEMQLLALCDAICEVVCEDPTGNLILRESPGLLAEYQLKLSEDAA